MLVDRYPLFKVEVVRCSVFLTVRLTIVVEYGYYTTHIDIRLYAGVAHKYAAAVAVHIFSRARAIIKSHIVYNINNTAATITENKGCGGVRT